jgi:predicted dehydrogenase
MDIAIPAAEAGCAILLEKPVAENLDRVGELRQAAAKSGARILIGFQFRYHPTLNKAKELIEAGALGKILTVHAHWGEYLPNWHPWEDYRQSYAARADLGGGVIVTLTHPLDYLRYLLGEVESLWSFNGHISPLELTGVEDVAEIGLKFASGAIGGVHVNYFQRPPVHRLEIVGTVGTLRWDNSDGILQFYRMPDAFGSWTAQPGATVLEQYHLAEGWERNHLFVAQMQHFLKVASGESAPICTLEDGVRALEMALAAKNS